MSDDSIYARSPGFPPYNVLLGTYVTGRIHEEAREDLRHKLGPLGTLEAQQEVMEEFFGTLLGVLLRRGLIDSGDIKEVLRVSAGEKVTFGSESQEMSNE